MQALAYQLGVTSGFWITESGGSVYSVADHKSWVLPQWLEFAQRSVPQARSYLENNLMLGGYSIPPVSNTVAQFESGMGWVKTVIIPPKDISTQEYFEREVLPVWPSYKESSNFKCEVGKAIDLNPEGLSKSSGMMELLALNQINPQKTPTIFIADAERDIPAARVLMNQGGFVGAVGNASVDFRAAVGNNSHGIVAPTSTNYHCSVINILNYFFR